MQVLSKQKYTSLSDFFEIVVDNIQDRPHEPGEIKNPLIRDICAFQILAHASTLAERMPDQYKDFATTLHVVLERMYKGEDIQIKISPDDEHKIKEKYNFG